MISIKKSGVLGIVVTGIAVALLGLTFYLAYIVFNTYFPFQPSQELTATMSLLLGAAIQAIFLGIMGWVGSILLMRGVDFMKVERGIGVVTFKVEKGLGLIAASEEEKKP